LVEGLGEAAKGLVDLGAEGGGAVKGFRYVRMCACTAPPCAPGRGGERVAYARLQVELEGCSITKSSD
jgi:hypothetical protein